MKKHKFRFSVYGTCAFFIICLACLNAHAQQKPAVKLFFEKVYLHTDRDVYSQGDTIWFKAYLFNGQTNTPIGTSNNLYTELISKDSSILVSREIVRLDQGLGSADFPLTDSIAPGKYTLRAYTNWMHNFGSNFIFEKEVTILNTTAAAKAAVSKTPAGKTAAVSQLMPVVNSGNSIVRFYPESGSLIEGVGSLVAVKAENNQGKGIATRGAVLSAGGDTVAAFVCDTLGMGLFLMAPAKGQTYRGMLLTGGKTNVNLPSALVKGFALRVAHKDSILNVIVNCNDATFADSVGRSLVLTGKHTGKTYFTKPIKLIGNQTLVRIPDGLFPEGITALTLIDALAVDQRKPKSQCERLVYIHHPDKVEPIRISTDKNTYASKEKVTVHIKTNGGLASLSMAAVDAGIVPPEGESMVSYMDLQSDVRGQIEHPERYYDTANVNRFKQLDLLLMTQGWRDFIWRRLADTAIRISYNTENSIAVSGKILSGTSDKPLIHTNITLFATAAKGQKLFSTVSDSSGKFVFNDLYQVGDHNVKLSSSNSKGEKKGAFTMDTLVTLPLPPMPKPGTYAAVDTAISTAMQAAAIKRESAVLAQKMKETVNLKEVKITSSRSVILGNGTPYVSFGPDQTFNITAKDYTFKTLEWWMLQNVKGALQSTDADVTGVEIRCLDTAMILDARGKLVCIAKSRLLPPQFFINGRDYTTDNEIEAQSYRTIYYPLTMDKIKRVVVKHLTTNLSCSFVDRYIIYLTVKDDALIGYNPGVMNPEVDGYYDAETFYKPQYSDTKNLTKTDLRTTIHWEPNITTDANGDATVMFYNADPKSKIRIVVEGLTMKGVPLTGMTGYVVK